MVGDREDVRRQGGMRMGGYSELPRAAVPSPQRIRVYPNSPLIMTEVGYIRLRLGEGALAKRGRVRGRGANSELAERPFNPRFRAPLLPRGEKGLPPWHARIRRESCLMLIVRAA